MLTPCYYCKREFPRALLTREHRRPKSRCGGGGRNVVLACRPCNEKKTDRTEAEFRAGVMSPRQMRQSIRLWQRLGGGR